MLLVERGLAGRGSKAQALIMSGQVYVDNQKRRTRPALPFCTMPPLRSGEMPAPM